MLLVLWKDYRAHVLKTIYLLLHKFLEAWKVAMYGLFCVVRGESLGPATLSIYNTVDSAAVTVSNQI